MRRRTSVTPPPSLPVFVDKVGISYVENEALGQEQERPNTAPPDISYTHDDMPAFFE